MMKASVPIEATLSYLPSSFQSAITTISWSLAFTKPEVNPPLFFKSLTDMKDIRKLQHQKQIKVSKDDISTDNFFLNIPESIHELFESRGDLNKLTTNEIDFAYISYALILLGNDYTDEAHDIITPYSWPDETHFGYCDYDIVLSSKKNCSINKYTSSSQIVKAYACAVHSLIHRKEGYNIGEYNMIGWQNANYWTNAALNNQEVNQLPHDDWFENIGKVFQDYVNVCASSNTTPENDWFINWAQKNYFLNNNNNHQDYFYDSRAVHELCSKAMKSTSSIQFRQVAEKIAEIELRILLYHTLQLAGYDVITNRNVVLLGNNNKNDVLSHHENTT